MGQSREEWGKEKLGEILPCPRIFDARYCDKQAQLRTGNLLSSISMCVLITTIYHPVETHSKIFFFQKAEKHLSNFRFAGLWGNTDRQSEFS